MILGSYNLKVVWISLALLEISWRQKLNESVAPVILDRYLLEQTTTFLYRFGAYTHARKDSNFE